MDPSVPNPAAYLLDFIRQTEVGTKARSGYDVIYGFNQRHLSKPLTSHTVDEAIAAGPSWTRRFKSSAAGGYQFMNATLKDLKRELSLGGSQVLDPNLQDRLGYHLLLRRGYRDFVDRKISRTEFGRRLSQEWASFPVLANVRGAHRNLTRGQSYYAGDGLNKALVTPVEFETILDNVLELSVPRPRPEPPVIEPEPTPAIPVLTIEENILVIEQALKNIKELLNG